ncbi:MAG: tRNA preQ1(34) S-adenosylmethionine ribosyltransferase-isomerase QueA [Gammaproteobacteria bacterium]
MKTTDFDYTLPESAIAQYPEKERTHSRLLCLDKQNGKIDHARFDAIIDKLHPNDLLVLNNSRVIPARLHGKKLTGGNIECLIERIENDHHALAHIRASKAPKPGTKLLFDQAVTATVIDRKNDLFRLHFEGEKTILDLTHEIGHMPLPPYIDRDDEKHDASRYQTVYAKPPGSVAAPTAGLHFDEDLLQRIKDKGINIIDVTLHVGAGTFQPVRAESIKDHIMHGEMIEVSQAVCDAVSACKKNNGRVIAVGTTSVRCLESAATNGDIQPYCGETSIFIYPGYKFKCVDAMITNFHLPKSTLLMLVSAFAGIDYIKHAYQVAIQEGYRFYSYGDACFIS